MSAERSLEPVLHQLRALLPELRKRYGVDTLEVFDLVLRRALKPRLRDRILGEAIPV